LWVAWYIYGSRAVLSVTFDGVNIKRRFGLRTLIAWSEIADARVGRLAELGLYHRTLALIGGDQPVTELRLKRPIRITGWPLRRNRLRFFVDASSEFVAAVSARIAG
jgi:hypothetical protein